MAAQLTATSLVDAAHAAMWQKIVTTPGYGGTLVTEVGVAAEYGIARPTAKAVVERLITDGLLVRDGRRGARVPLLTEPDVRDIYWNRLLLETEAHTLLARAGAVPVDARLANQQMRLHAEADDRAHTVAADIAFHRRLVEAAGSIRLAKLHAVIMAEAHFCMGQVQAQHLLPSDVSLSEHQGILDAITARDVELVVQRTHEHLERGRDSLITGMFPPQAAAAATAAGE